VRRSSLEPSFEPERDLGRLLERALHPPFGDVRFWGVQLLVFAIAALLWAIRQSGNIEPAGIPVYVPVCLFVIPVAYAALNFGLAGSLATAGWTILLSLPLVLLQAPSRLYMWAEVTQFFMVLFVALFVGDRVEREVLARRQSERIQAALRQLFEASPVPTMLLSMDGRILQGNAAALRMFSGSAAGRLPSHLADLVGPETALDVLSGKGTPFELSVPASGERVLRPVTATWELTEGPGLQVMFFDVSEEQRRADRADAYAAWVLRGHEEERQRIAKELHDEPVQALVHLCRQLDLLAEEAPEGDGREGIVEVRSLATSINDDLRRIAKGLRPPSLDDLGLVAAVRRLAKDLEQRHGLKVELRVAGRRSRLPTDTELALFRIAQEALRNVERHSAATRVEVALQFTAGAVRLRIRDDGRGFDSAADWARAGSLGLIGMQERATLLGGELEVESAAGHGTTVRASLPVRRAPSRPEPEAARANGRR
jgi:signal transduction histidine kinase